MSFYNLTLKRSTAINLAICGDFIGNNKQQIITSSGRYLTLWNVIIRQPLFTLKTGRKFAVPLRRLKQTNTSAKKPSTFRDSTSGKIKMKKIVEVDIYGCIRSMKSFRPRREKKDYVIIGSDSGKIVILRYNNNIFEKVLQKTLGASDSAKTTPGKYLAVDSKTRGIMMGALENVKHVNIFKNRSCKHRPVTFTNTLFNASTENTLIYDMIAIGSQKHLVFACLEAKYKDVFPNQELAEVPKQFVAFYKVNIPKNSITCYPLGDLTVRGNFLISVPSDTGLLLCASNCIVYLKRNSPNVYCPIPRRVTDIPERPIIFVCATTCEVEGACFFLAQTEQGDIFRITLEKKDGKVMEIKLKYFTTVHVASALCFLKAGFLFVASEFGNHYLYKIMGLESDGLEFRSSAPLHQKDTFFFKPEARKNLLLVKELPSLSPIMHLEMVHPKHDKKPYLCVACGRGPSSTLRILKLRPKNSGNKYFKEISKYLLESTPRKFSTIPKTPFVILIETDHNAYTLQTKEDLKEKYKLKGLSMASDLLWKEPGQNIPNIYQCTSGMWVSSVVVLHILNILNSQNGKSEASTIEMYREQLEQNEAAFCLTLVKFASQGNDQYLLIGINKLELDPIMVQSGRIYTYKISVDVFELVHITVVEDCPTAMCPFQGCVLIGIGGVLKMFDYSEIMLFVRYERNLCNRIVSIHNWNNDNRICVGDIKDGFFYLLYNPKVDKENSQEKNIMEVIAEDDDPTWITTACLWKKDKLAIANKFGNIFIVKLPPNTPRKCTDIHKIIKDILPQKYPEKAETLAAFHVGEMVCCMQVGKFVSQNNSEVLVYGTISGSIGILAPLEKNKETSTLLQLELLMRVVNRPLCGGNHLTFRSYCYPVLDIIDGDFLEQYYLLSDDDQRIIDKYIDGSPIKIMQNLRLKYLGEERIIPVNYTVPKKSVNKIRTPSDKESKREKMRRISFLVKSYFSSNVPGTALGLQSNWSNMQHASSNMQSNLSSNMPGTSSEIHSNWANKPGTSSHIQNNLSSNVPVISSDMQSNWSNMQHVSSNIQSNLSSNMPGTSSEIHSNWANMPGTSSHIQNNLSSNVPVISSDMQSNWSNMQHASSNIQSNLSSNMQGTSSEIHSNWANMPGTSSHIQNNLSSNVPVISSDMQSNWENMPGTSSDMQSNLSCNMPGTLPDIQINWSNMQGTSSHMQSNLSSNMPGTSSHMQSNLFSNMPGTSSDMQSNLFSNMPGTSSDMQKN